MKLRALLAGALLLTLIIGSSHSLKADDVKAPQPVTKAAITPATTDKETKSEAPTKVSPLLAHATGYWSIKLIVLAIVLLIGTGSALMIPINRTKEEEAPPMVRAVVPPLRKMAPATQFYVYR